MSKKVYGYVRSATNNEEQLRNQYDVISTYCKKNNLKPDKVVVGSGSGLDVSKELKAVVNDLQEGDIIVVSDMARITRDMGKCIDILEAIENKKAKIIVVDMVEGGYEYEQLHRI